MRTFFKSVLAIVVILSLAVAGYYFMRPSPAQGVATVPSWVKASDEARVDRPAQALQPFHIVETGEAFLHLREAVARARSGATVEIEPGTYTTDCAVVNVDVLTIRAMVPGSVTLEKEMCEGKAALVLRGGLVTVEGLRFRGYRAYDANGAGVRAEAGRILIRDSTFEDSDTGVLGNENLDGSVTILHSIFRRLGGCPPDKKCAHSVYLGRIGEVAIRDSLFEQGTGGHYIKLRGPKVDVADNLVDDSKGKGTNYLVELPNGAAGTISGNTLIKGTHAENRCCAIVIGVEGVQQPSPVAIRDNVAVNLADWPVIFVGDVSGEARVGANDARGWFIGRTGLRYKGRCVGCKLLN